MVRAFLKGGVWKNSEDEVLKAAVQKYGKQDWSRVASLLNRKSAKQCKARWYEWLDPGVRKVEWSREEEEKLLHLAKLMPAQWKTIGPLVGDRTAIQCQEHYEKLLDEAASGQKEEENEDLRNNQQPLRVGQIDSHPESKPARPDPIDMDEDEIEMLQEARARLANTQGKKAKRKAREKMLLQAKRLAELQKRRELKQAGLVSSQAKRKASRRSKEIDLGVEIPFYKSAPAGFHDTSGEASRTESIRKQQLKNVDFKKINEQQYRSRDREESQAKKREEARLRALEKSNMQYVVAQVSKTNDPLNIRKRGALSLPEPTVTDSQLKEMAKLGQASSNRLPETSGGGSGATATLLADYSDRPLPTPMRTPLTSSSTNGSSKHESILREASNLRMLERGQTPLLGGEDVEMQIATPDKEDEQSVLTPGGVSARAATPLRRDHFGLNRPHSELRGGSGALDDASSVGGSTFATSAVSIREQAREERRAAKRARKELDAALAALPSPQFDYELEAPMDVNDDDEKKVETVFEDDAADLEAAERKRQQEEADKLYEARSSVVKRKDVPRPFGIIPETIILASSEAETLIEEERWTMLRHDANAFPVEAPPSVLDDKKKKKKKSKAIDHSAALPPETPLDFLPEQALNAAKGLIQLEMNTLMEEKTQPLLAEGKALEEAKTLLEQETNKARENTSSEVFVDKGWTKMSSKSQTASCELEFDTLQEAATVLRRKNEKLESKLVVLTGGLAKRAESMGGEVAQIYGDYRNALIEGAVYTNLREQEGGGAVKRIDQLRADVARLREDELRLQGIYQQMMQQPQPVA